MATTLGSGRNEGGAMNDSITLGPGEGKVLEAWGSRIVFKAVAAVTDGTFSLMERDLPAGGRMPPAHTHPTTLEAFFVLEGEVEFVLGTHQARAGVVCVGAQRVRPHVCE